MARVEIKFRDGNDTLTLWPEREWEDGYILGWCVERQKHFVIAPTNVVSVETEEPSE